MKKYIIIISLLLFVGCNKSSTLSAPSCTELTTAYWNAATASGADPTNKVLCDASMAAYLALIYADCPGFTNLSQTQINAISTLCD